MDRHSALYFPVFQDDHYARENPDVAKNLKRGRFATARDQWQRLGRDEFLAGMRKVGAPSSGLEFDEAKYLAHCPDIRLAVASRETPSGFAHWMRYGLMETLAGTRIDAFDVLRKGEGCLLESTQAGTGKWNKWISLLALPGFPAGKERSLLVRDATGAWVEPERTFVREVPGMVVKDGSLVPGAWLAMVFLTATEPAQVFFGTAGPDGVWSEIMIAKVADDVHLSGAVGHLDAAQLCEGLVRSGSFSGEFGSLLDLLKGAGAISQSPHQQLYVDHLEVLNDGHLHALGWYLDRLAPWEKLLFMLGGQVVVVEKSQCHLHPRPDLLAISGVTDRDVHDAGFLSVGRIGRHEARVEKAQVVGLAGNRVSMIETPVNYVDDAPDAAIRRCINFMSGAFTRTGQLPAFLQAGAGPILGDMIRRRNETLDTGYELKEFGAVPEHPRATIVVPLYGRVDFVQFQLAQFSRDPEMSNVELIYVLDDPRVLQSCLNIADLSAKLFRLPFRLQLMRENQGFAGANNAGASIARGESLVFLNSDVIPTEPGWVARLTAPLTSDLAGIVGARLLYHDGTIQHDGMAYRRSEPQSMYGGMYECIHPGKGMAYGSSVPAVVEVPLVTGACFAIRKADFCRVGGFSTDFFVGDYEDSDLCLKLRRIGRKILLARNCVLHHLERQSVPRNSESASTSILNAWIHESKWGGTLDGLAARREVRS